MFDITKAKKEFYILLLSLSCLLFFICWGVFFRNKEPDIEGNENVDIEYEDLSSSYNFDDKYYYNQLSPSLKAEFAKIYDGVCKYQSAIVVNNLSIQNLNRIVYILHFDCPELFYLSDSAQNFNHIGDNVTTYYPQYIYTKETSDKMGEEIADKIQPILLRLKGSSPQAIEKFIHDYLISNVTYNQETENCMNIYGAIIEGKANCKGYSSAFTYLTRLLGVTSAQVIGHAAESDMSVGHSWNVIKLNNMYYYIDVCWDDFDGNEKYGGLNGSYIFYNLPANKMALSHNPTETITNLGDPPNDNDSSLVYYKGAKLYATDLSSARKIIHDGIARIDKRESYYILIQCDTREIYNNVIANIQSFIKDEIENQGYDFSGCDLVDIKKSNTIILTKFVRAAENDE